MDDKHRPHVVVTGGCGFMGRHLVRALCERGCAVTIVDLEPVPAELAGLPVTLLRRSILEADQLHSLLPTCDAVVHLAANVFVFFRERNGLGRGGNGRPKGVNTACAKLPNAHLDVPDLTASSIDDVEETGLERGDGPHCPKRIRWSHPRGRASTREPAQRTSRSSWSA